MGNTSIASVPQQKALKQQKRKRPRDDDSDQLPDAHVSRKKTKGRSLANDRESMHKNKDKGKKEPPLAQGGREFLALMLREQEALNNMLTQAGEEKYYKIPKSRTTATSSKYMKGTRVASRKALAEEQTLEDKALGKAGPPGFDDFADIMFGRKSANPTFAKMWQLAYHSKIIEERKKEREDHKYYMDVMETKAQFYVKAGERIKHMEPQEILALLTAI